MKRILALILAMFMLFSLAACGDKDGGGNNDASTTAAQNQEDIQTTEAPNNSDDGSDDDSDDDLEDFENLDFLSILGADSDRVYAKMSSSDKAALVASAKAYDIDVDFKSDGSTVFTYPDGTVMVQNEDGSLGFGTEDGDISSFSANWPDNEFTRTVPKPDFETAFSAVNGDEFSVLFSGATIEQVRDYTNEVKKAGFDKDPESEDAAFGDMVVFSYKATNSKGYEVDIYYSYGVSGMTITK